MDELLPERPSPLPQAQEAFEVEETAARGPEAGVDADRPTLPDEPVAKRAWSVALVEVGVPVKQIGAGCLDGPDRRSQRGKDDRVGVQVEKGLEGAPEGDELPEHPRRPLVPPQPQGQLLQSTERRIVMERKAVALSDPAQPVDLVIERDDPERQIGIGSLQAVESFART